MYRLSKFLVPGAALILALTALVLSAIAFTSQAQDSLQPAAATIPGTISYQGFLTDDLGDPVDGPVNLQFDLFKDSSGGISLWTETHNAVQVDQGYFAVQLGSITPLSAADFALPVGSSNLYIQVSILPVGGGQIALPRQPLASAPYAFLAEQAAAAPWSGISGLPAGFADNLDDVEFDNLITVAKSGGQFDSIQAAVDSITDAASDNRYQIWVAPGRYHEQVLLKPFVYLTGAGRWLTIIESDVSNLDIYPPTEATLQVTDYANVSDLTVINNGEGYRNVAILVQGGAVQNLLNDLVVVANGPGFINYGTLITGVDTKVTLEDVNSRASSADMANIGLEITGGAEAVVQDGLFGADNGDWAIGIVGREAETRLDLFDVTAQASDTANGAIGLNLSEGAIANAHGGWFKASNAITETRGIAVWPSSAMEGWDVYAIGLDGPTWNHGLSNVGGLAMLHSGSYFAFGGVESLSILNSEGGTLEATGIFASAESASDRNDGLRNELGAASTVTGGFFRGRGGLDNRGLANYNLDSFMDLNQITAYGEGGAVNFGISNEDQGYVSITASKLWGNTNALLSEGSTTRLHLSRLFGGPVGGAGDNLCLAITYSGAFYPDTCPN